MSFSLRFMEQAENDILLQFTKYRDEDPDLGIRFLSELDSYLNRIQSSPFLYAVSVRGLRATPLRKFPHVVYYKVIGEDVRIFAVIHGRRQTRGIRTRMPN